MYRPWCMDWEIIQLLMVKNTQSTLKDTAVAAGANLKHLISLPSPASFQDSVPPQKADFGVKLSVGRREGWRESVLRFGFPPYYPHLDLIGNKSNLFPQSDFPSPSL